VFSYSGGNNIGNMGCRYLSRSSLNRIKDLWLSKSKVTKTAIILEVRECCTSPRHSGTLETIGLCKQNIDLGHNELGIDGIRWLVSAKWSGIKSIDLGKTNQI
jgi:hypothetical protein